MLFFASSAMYAYPSFFHERVDLIKRIKDEIQTQAASSFSPERRVKLSSYA
jgi:hypothetical protein